MKKTIRFEVDAKAITSADTALTVPIAASAKISSDHKTQRGIKAEGIFNGLPFRSAIDSDEKGGHMLKIDANMKKVAMGVVISDDEAKESVIVEITRLGEEVETRVPADLAKALAGAPKAKAVWVNITPIARRDWIFWIITGKLAKTRISRIEKACDMLSGGKRRVCCFGGINWLMKAK